MYILYIVYYVFRCCARVRERDLLCKVLNVKAKVVVYAERKQCAQHARRAPANGQNTCNSRACIYRSNELGVEGAWGAFSVWVRVADEHVKLSEHGIE